MTYTNLTLAKMGFWSAAVAALCGLCYILLQVLSGLKLLPELRNLSVIFIPPLILSLSFVVTMVSLHYAAEKRHKLLTSVAVAFATLYCSDVTLVYFTQFALTQPRGETNGLLSGAFLFDDMYF